MNKFIKHNWTKFIIAMSICFTCCFAIFAYTKIYAYSIDENGDLIGDNLFNNNNLNSTNLITSSQINNYNITTEFVSFVTTLNANDPYMYFDDIIILSSGTYTLSIESNQNIQQIGLTYDGSTNFIYSVSNTNSSYVSFTISNTSTFGFGIELFNGTTNIKIMLNTGSEPISWEPYGVWYSETNYDDLQNALNSLTNNVNPFDENISEQKLFINDVLYTSYSDYDYVFTTNKRNLIIDSSGIRDIYVGLLNSQEGTIRYELTLNQPVSTFNITMQTYLPFDLDINMYNNTNQNVLSYTIDSMGGVNGDGYYEYGEILNVKKIIIEMNVNQDTSNRNNSYISFGSSYADGYNDGINQNNTYWHTEYLKLSQEIEFLNEQIISLNESLSLVYGQRDLLQIQNDNLINTNNQYSTQVIELNTRINTLTTNLNTLQIAYNDLNESYTNMLSGNNFANLFFVIAETPFTSFKQIWNVDFLGVNLAGFVTGILFLGLIIWVIKKIF